MKENQKKWHEDALIAPCGMNCGLCISYQAMKYDLKKQGMNRKYCPGCIPRGENCTHSLKNHCDLIGKGKVRFCYECDSFPCKYLEALDKRYQEKYHMSMIENLEYIRDHGIDRFLEAEEEKWKCQECGETICCHNGLCLNCGLDILRENKKYRWGEE